MATVVSMKALLESGVHFGHRTNKWDPAMKPFIFTERNGIHIIDLQQTAKMLNTAYNVVRDAVMAGGTVLFIGTKRQAQETIQEEATRCGMPYVTERWLGGTLTNWVTIFQRLQEMERLEHMHETGEIERLTKKEGLMIDREVKRLQTRLNGIRSMKKLPELIFVVDVSREVTSIHEANLKKIPVLAMVDTNCNPSGVDYIIPSNDDAIRAIKLLVGKIADAVLEGKAMRKDVEEEIPGEGFGTTSASAARAGRVGEESELEDKDLLGESTLAKLGGKKPAAEILVAESDDTVTADLPEEPA
jgi:small subunit ribosomal protein S2